MLATLDPQAGVLRLLEQDSHGSALKLPSKLRPTRASSEEAWANISGPQADTVRSDSGIEPAEMATPPPPLPTVERSSGTDPLSRAEERRMRRQQRSQQRGDGA